MKTEDEIIGIIEKYISKVEYDFDDYLCYVKYGQEKFLSKGFYPTNEDFAYKMKVIYPGVLDEAIAEIRSIENSKELLEKIDEQNANSDVIEWASIMLKSFM